MLAAVAKVKNAVASKAIVPALMWYVVYEGAIHAADGRLIASAPFPCEESFAVHAGHFDAVLSRLHEAASEDKLQLKLTDGWVNLSAGKYRGRVQRMSADKARFIGPTGTLIPVGENFVTKLKQMRPFISDNAAQQFAICLCLRGDRILATNNVALVVCDDTGLPEDLDAMLPCWAVDYILARQEQLTHIQYDDKSMSFHWDDSSWMRTPLLAIPFPNIDAILDSAEEPDFELTPEWKRAYRIAASMADNSVKIFADKIVGGTKPLEGSGITDAEVEVDAESPIPESKDYSAWNPEFLTPVIEGANFWKPDCFPKPAPFAGNEIYGVIMGRARD